MPCTEKKPIYLSFHFEMEADLWEKLPEALLFNVLALLPLSSLLHFRSVCKRWNSLIRRPEFLDLRRESGSPSLHQEILRQVRQCSRARRLRVVDSHGPFVLMADFNGILMAENDFKYPPDYVFHAQDLCVVGPSGGFVKQIPYFGALPRHARSQWYTAAIVSKPGTEEYDIILILMEPDFPMTRFVYHRASDIGVWQDLGKIMPPDPERYSELRGVAVMSGGKFVILLRSNTWHPHYHQVMVLEEKTRCWVDLRGVLPQTKYKSPLLFTHAGRLFLAVLAVDGCHLWKHEEQAAAWVLFDELNESFFTPEEVTQINAASDASEFYTVYSQLEKALYQGVDGDFLYFGRCSGRDGECPNVTMRYNLIDRVWDEMPLEGKHAVISGSQDKRTFFYHTGALSQADD